MIDFGLSDEETMMREAASAFALTELRPRQREHEDTGVSVAICQRFETTGFGGMALPLEAGGLNATMLAQCLVLEEFAFGDAGATLQLFLPSWSRAMCYALGLKPPELDAFYFGGEDVPLPTGLRWYPRRQNQGRILGVNRAGMWAVGVWQAQPVKSLGLNAAGGIHAHIQLEDQGNIEPEKAAFAIAKLRLWVSALFVGISRAAFEYVSRYVQDRTAFGKSLSQHQALAFVVADMAMRVDAARLLVHSQCLAENQSAGAANTYIECLETAQWVTNYAVQLLGGHGYIKDHPVEKWMRDARALALLWGGIDEALIDAAGGELENAWN